MQGIESSGVSQIFLIMERQMPTRTGYSKALPLGAMKAMQTVQQAVNESGLDPAALEFGEASRFPDQRLHLIRTRRIRA